MSSFDIIFLTIVIITAYICIYVYIYIYIYIYIYTISKAPATAEIAATAQRGNDVPSTLLETRLSNLRPVGLALVVGVEVLLTTLPSALTRKLLMLSPSKRHSYYTI